MSDEEAVGEPLSLSLGTAVDPQTADKDGDGGLVAVIEATLIAERFFLTSR